MVLLSERAEIIHKQYKLDEINRIENIMSARNAYKNVGNDPNRYRPSAEALHRRLVKGNGLYFVNNIVDTLNLVSLESGISIGGYDLQTIKGEITFGLGKKDEVYQGIGKGILNITSLPVLRDSVGPFGTPTSDSERTKICPTTNQVLFVFFDFGFYPGLHLTLDNCERYLKCYCFACEIQRDIINC